MKRQYADAKRRIEKVVAVVEPLLDLPGVRITHRFIESLNGNNDPNVIAETEYEYQYRDGVMRWYLPAVCRLDDDELEDTVFHEYGHVLVAPIEQHLPEKFKGEQNELAVENVSRSLTSIYRRGAR